MTEVLDLAAAFDRDTVKLPDGSTKELRNQQEFSILDWHRVVRMDAEAKKLQKQAAASEEKAKELAKLQQDLAAMLVVDLDQEIPDWACAAILRFWAERITSSGSSEGSDDGPPPKRPTTGGSSQGSKRSTAGTRKTGSRKSRATR